MPYQERDWSSFWKINREPTNGVYGPPNPLLLEYARRFLEGKNNPSALDLASGDGRYTLPLAIMGYDVTALDISKEAIDRLNERAIGLNTGMQIHTETADIFRVLGKKRGYDLIICSGLIEEIPQSMHNKLILGLQEWTNSSGINILRFVTEKKISLDAEAEAVADHDYLEKLYRYWNILRSGVDVDLRQAKVGREIDGKMINRFFKAATIVATKK